MRTSPERVLDDYRRVLQLSGCDAMLAAADRTVAYGNLTWGRFFPAVSSPPWQLEGLAAFAPGSGWTWAAGTGHTNRPGHAARAYGWPTALGRHGQTFTPVTPVAREQLRPYPKRRSLLVLDRIFPEGLPVPESLWGTVAVHLPTFKTHGQVGFAGALENAWATWLPSGGGLAAAYPHEVIVDLLLLQRATHTGICAVMDGTIVGDGAGPRTVEPREGNVLLASTDPVALDAVAVQLAGSNPFTVRYLALAHAAGLGCADLDAIEIVGDDVAGLDLRLHARRPPAALARTLLEQMNLAAVERWLFRRRAWLPLASTLYYDHLWYRSVGRTRLAAFRRSPWGALFASYQAA
ncbi:MAG: DUF362 domain-containing protein [Chloroflexi bacterium]|nr:DUF362 domain-containing protein [Chloroflexota bacterium]